GSARLAGESERRQKRQETAHDTATGKPQAHATTEINPPGFVPAGPPCGLRLQNTKLKRPSPMNSRKAPRAQRQNQGPITACPACRSQRPFCFLSASSL